VGSMPAHITEIPTDFKAFCSGRGGSGLRQAGGAP
jgi:hypothetical protein